MFLVSDKTKADSNGGVTDFKTLAIEGGGQSSYLQIDTLLDDMTTYRFPVLGGERMEERGRRTVFCPNKKNP